MYCSVVLLSRLMDLITQKCQIIEVISAFLADQSFNLTKFHHSCSNLPTTSHPFPPMCFRKLFSRSRGSRTRADGIDSAASCTDKSVVLNAEKHELGTEKMNDPTTDMASSKKDPPPYSSVKKCFLDPNLEFCAEEVRQKIKLVRHEDRDRVFAKAIVKHIAGRLEKETVPAPYKGSWGYSYGGGSELHWDKLIGYPATEAFKNERVSFIITEAKLDLEKRGFVVEELELTLSNGKCKGYEDKIARDCKGNATECYCWYHGIFVDYKLS